MAKKNKITFVEESKPVKKYYAKYANYTFSYPAVYVDENGDVKESIKRHPEHGYPIMMAGGKFVKDMIEEKFRPIRTKLSQGFLSEAIFDPNTDDPQKLVRGKELERLVNGIDVLTEDQKDKDENEAAWLEKQKRRELENRVKKAEAQAAKVGELEAKLKALEAGK